MAGARKRTYALLLGAAGALVGAVALVLGQSRGGGVSFEFARGAAVGLIFVLAIGAFVRKRRD